MKFRLALVLLTFALHGCATMSSDECAAADWRAFGYEDGAHGATLDKAGKRAKACTKHGYAMDHAAYHQGRDEGLNNYCTPGVGYQTGERGQPYNGVCVDHGEDRFLAAYYQGFELYGFTSAVQIARKHLRQAESRHANLSKELRKYASGHRDEDLSTEEHNEMVLDIWAERRWLAKEAIPYWTVEHRYAQRELEGYNAKVAAGDPSLGNLKPRGFSGPDPYNGPTRADAIEMLAEVFGRIGSR